MKKIIEPTIAVVYHAECPDGFSASYAAWKKFGNRAIYIPGYYQVPPPKELYGKDVYLLDYSYKDDVIDALLPKVKSITMIDHHKTSEATVKRLGGVYALNNSGCVLAWKYFHHGKPVPRFFKNIEDIDLWKFKLPHTDELAEIATFYPMEYKMWDKLVRAIDTKEGLKKYLAEGKILTKKRDDTVAKLSACAEKIRFEGHDCYLVNSPVVVSHLGNNLVKKLPPIAVIWSRRGNKMIISLRSDGTVDVAKIAEKYGGGGHKSAAGFSWEEKDFLKFKKR